MNLHNELKALYEATSDDPAALKEGVGELLDQYDEAVPLAEFARRVDRSTRTVLNWIDAGRIKAENRSQGEERPRYFIRLSELQKVR